MRQEKKYIIPTFKTQLFKKTIINLGFQVHHKYNLINNIYFDDLNMSSAYENIEGDLFRSKYRIRWYGINDEKYTLEKKQKFSSSGIKEKIRLSATNIADAILETENRTNLNAIIANAYYREYFIREGVRITIDSNLKFKVPKGKTSMNYPNNIVEIKYDTEALPDLDNIISQLTPLTKFSKYLTGLETLSLI